MANSKELAEAFGYMRTSSATNVGADKDSEARQRKAIEGYAKAAGFVAVKAKPGFAKVLDRIAGNGVKTIVESPDRFARDLAVQISRPRLPQKQLGIALIPATAIAIRSMESGIQGVHIGKGLVGEIEGFEVVPDPSHSTVSRWAHGPAPRR